MRNDFLIAIALILGLLLGALIESHHKNSRLEELTAGYNFEELDKVIADCESQLPNNSNKKCYFDVISPVLYESSLPPWQ